MRRALTRAVEWSVRLLGIGLALFGLWLLIAGSPFGVGPLLVGLVMALRPWVLRDVLEIGGDVVALFG